MLIRFRSMTVLWRVGKKRQMCCHHLWIFKTEEQVFFPSVTGWRENKATETLTPLQLIT